MYGIRRARGVLKGRLLRFQRFPRHASGQSVVMMPCSSQYFSEEGHFTSSRAIAFATLLFRTAFPLMIRSGFSYSPCHRCMQVPANNVGMDPAALNAAVISSLAPLVEVGQAP